MKHKIFAFLGCLVLFSACKKEEDSPVLKPDFNVPSQELLTGDSITFTDLSEGQPSTWSWEFEGGTPATSDLSGPVVTYNTPGTYAVSLQITNNKTSAVEKKTGYITVGYRDVAVNFSSSAVTIMQHEQITFTDESAGLPNQWAWEFKSGSTVINSTEQNPTIKFTEPGVYDVKLVATNPKGNHTLIKEKLITVVDITAIDAEFESDFRSTYTGGSIKFTDKSIGTATAWKWTFEGADTGVSTSQHPTVKYSKAGRYKVTLIASNASKSSVKEKVAYILVVPGNALTAFYPLDGQIDDAGPSKLKSTLVGAVSFDQADRKLMNGGAGLFNSTGGFFVPDHDAMNFGTGDYSVSVWMKTSTNTRGMIWQESGAKASGDNQTWLRILGTATNLTSFATEDPTGGSTINLTTAANGAAATTNNGVWHHVVCVRKGAVTSIYIDAMKIKEATASTTKVTSNNGTFKVGMQEGAAGYSNHYNGQIDDLIIYKKALTQDEVEALYKL